MKFMLIILIAAFTSFTSGDKNKTFYETTTVTIEYGRGSQCIGRGICKIEDADFTFSDRLAILTFDAHNNKIIKIDIPSSQLSKRLVTDQFKDNSIKVDHKILYKKKGQKRSTAINPGNYKIEKSPYGYSVIFTEN